MATAVALYYFLNNHLGTPIRLIDNTGTVVWQAAYLSFGKAEVTVATITNNLRFPGQYFDKETGLHYNMHRYYEPDTGRYITADPIGLNGGINLYAYVAGNPVNWVDPWGLDYLNCLADCITDNDPMEIITDAVLGKIAVIVAGGGVPKSWMAEFAEHIMKDVKLAKKNKKIRCYWISSWVATR